MKTGDKLWVRESSAGKWLEATYEFRIELSEPLGHHSVMLASGGGRRVVCGCNTSTVDPAQDWCECENVYPPCPSACPTRLERLAKEATPA